MNWNQINDGAYDEVIFIDNALLRWIQAVPFRLSGGSSGYGIISIAHCGCDSVK
jgi:hypothetical protein